jgi:hypothetical protein
MAAKKKTENSVKQERNKYTATGESATSDDTVKGLDPEKAIGFPQPAKVKEKPKVVVTETAPPSKRRTATPEERATISEGKVRSGETADRYQAAEDKDLAQTEDTLTRIEREKVRSAEEEKIGPRYSGEGYESGRPISETKYPMPTSKAENATDPNRTMEGRASGKSPLLNFTGSGDLKYVKPANAMRIGESTQQLDDKHVRGLMEAKPHQVTSARRTLETHRSNYGTPHKAQQFCANDSCRNVIKESGADKFADAYDAGNVTWRPVGGTKKPFIGIGQASGNKGSGEFCGGGVCNTAVDKSTPTPRPPKSAVEGDGYA